MSDPSVNGYLTLRLVAAYGLRRGALAPYVPPERPPYVPYCEALGVGEHRRSTPESMAWAARLWREGWTMKRIASEVGVTFHQVDAMARRHRDLFPRRNGRAHGEPGREASECERDKEVEQ